MIRLIIKPFLIVMDFCYTICKNYGIAIILFTFFSKIILLPVTLFVHTYSIKIVKMQPELNFAKAKYFGDKEKIAEEESVIYKKYKYNPFVSLIPTFLQLILLMGVIEVIKSGINSGSYDMNFIGLSLANIPSKVGGMYILAPFLAALSALIMCLCQNKSNVIQAEQGKIGQLITMAISVGLSLYLGFFVSMGVAIYWIFSNFFSTVQLYILNFIINPKKHVDYEQLEKSKEALRELENLGNNERNEKSREYKKREKADYKRFFSVVNKHIVFYSESNGFYKYFKALIEYLLEKTSVTIHYITSDPEDNIFKMAEENNRIRAYYIGEKRLITLMMKMDSDIVVMTMPDLDNYHIKRSYVRSDIEYIFVQHSLGSVNLTYRKGALDNFDTIICPCKCQKDEILALEKLNNLKSKKIVECGYFILDDMIDAYNNMDVTISDDERYILIAPSWQEDNIVDLCLDELLEELSKTKYRIIVRPHPQHVKHNKEKLELLKQKFSDNKNIEIQLDFSATDTVWNADMLITDWSNISMEYAFCTHRPVLFINTPMKIMNPEYKSIDIVPNIVAIRDIIGCQIGTDELDKVPEMIDNLLGNLGKYEKQIIAYEEDQIYNIGSSAEVGGKYIVESLKENMRKKKNEQ